MRIAAVEFVVECAEVYPNQTHEILDLVETADVLFTLVKIYPMHNVLQMKALALLKAIPLKAVVEAKARFMTSLLSLVAQINF